MKEEEEQNKREEHLKHKAQQESQKLFKLIRMLRSFYLFRYICLKQKFEREIKNSKVESLNKEGLIHQMQELEEKQTDLKKDLIQCQKSIAIFDHNNNKLKKEVRQLTFDKIDLYKIHTNVRSRII